MASKARNKFIKRCDNIPYKEIEGEVLLLNLRDGNYFGLNRTGMLIWKMLDGRRSSLDIVKALKRRFNLREDTAKKHLNDFLKELKKYKLIEYLASR